MSKMMAAGTGLLMAGVVVLSACAPEPPRGAQAASVASGLSDESVVVAREDGELVLHPGQLLAVELASNASTGYAWEIEADGAPVLAPASVPAPVSSETQAPPIVGAGGVSRWRFKAVQPGTTEVRLVYRRPWEKDVAPVETVRYRVRVE